MNRDFDLVVGLGDIEGDLLHLAEQVNMSPLQVCTVVLARAGIEGDHDESFPVITRSGLDQRGHLLWGEGRFAALAFA